MHSSSLIQTNITLVFVTDSVVSKVSILINEKKIPFVYSQENQHGHLCVNFSCKLSSNNIISILVNDENPNIKLIEIIADDIRFGLVTFLCTTIDSQQHTQLTVPGKIDIEISTPIWKFWCEKMNAFNYKDYPLGSIN
jgi:hypothetical protein